MSLERAILSGGFGCEFTALFNTSAAFDPAPSRFLKAGIWGKENKDVEQHESRHLSIREPRA
jgi:hypothetical protein